MFSCDLYPGELFLQFFLKVCSFFLQKRYYKCGELFFVREVFNTLLLGGFIANNRSVPTGFCHVCFNIKTCCEIIMCQKGKTQYKQAHNFYCFALVEQCGVTNP